MITTSKVSLVAIPVALAFVWPFTGTETVMVMTSLGGMAVAIIGALKATAANNSAAVAAAKAEEAKLAVNGHLAKLETEQAKAKSDKEAEFSKLLEVVKAASRAEGEEFARKAAELLAAKVAEGVAAKALQTVAVPAMLAAATQPASIPPVGTAAPTKRIDAAIEELTDAAEETSKSADITTDLTKKHPR